MPLYCTVENIIIKGIGGSITVPLCRLYLNSDLYSGPVTVAVQETLPISGVSFLMGNDLGGRKIVPDPIVCSEPAAEVKNQIPDLPSLEANHKKCQRRTKIRLAMLSWEMV